jgi:hypothetical protein
VNGGYSTLESNDKEVAAPPLAGVGRSHHQDAVCSQQLRYYLILAKKEVWNGTGKMSQIAQHIAARTIVPLYAVRLRVMMSERWIE